MALKTSSNPTETENILFFQFKLRMRKIHVPAAGAAPAPAAPPAAAAGAAAAPPAGTEANLERPVEIGKKYNF